jgi:tetratricopeptide (TPR) repeat protein
MKVANQGLLLPPGYPADESFKSLIGIALVGLERYSEALPVLDGILAGLPGPVWPEARFALSQCYVKAGQPYRGYLELIRALNESNDWPGYDRALNMLESEFTIDIANRMW